MEDIFDSKQIIFVRQEDAETVLKRLKAILDRDGYASIGDFLGLANLDRGEFDETLGWTNLDDASIVTIAAASGYRLKLPSPIRVRYLPRFYADGQRLKITKEILLTDDHARRMEQLRKFIKPEALAGEHGADIPERMSIPNNRPAIADLVIADIRKRVKIGVERYGTPLQGFNGRDALWDAYQEVIDLAQYLRQAIYERDEKAAGYNGYDV